MLFQQGRNIFQYGIPAFMTVVMVFFFFLFFFFGFFLWLFFWSFLVFFVFCCLFFIFIGFILFFLYYLYYIFFFYIILEDLPQLFVSAAAVVQLGQGILLDHGTKRTLHGQGTATDIT